jgi:hypothetical protein
MLRSSKQHSRLEQSDASAPASRFLSNGRLSVHITGLGTGCTSFAGYKLNRWRGDPIEGRDGLFVYLRDLDSLRTWSIGYQPTCLAGAKREIMWHPGIFKIVCVDDGIEATMEICVPSEVDIDLRRITLSNLTAIARRIEVTTFAEIALNLPVVHETHPVFSRLFVETEFVPEHRTILARRRPRSNTESHPWLVHALVDDLNTEHETDRGHFLGRGRDAGNPQALSLVDPLSGTNGNVLDPAVSLRTVIDLGPGTTARFAFAFGAAVEREEALAAVRSLTDHREVDLAFERARAREEELISRHGLTPQRSAHLQALAGAILFGEPYLRAGPEVIARAEGSPADLAALGLPSNRQLVVLHAEWPPGARLLPDLLTAVGYWQAMGLPIDLLVLVDDPTEAATIKEVEFEGYAYLRLGVAGLSSTNVDRIDAVARLVIRDALPDLVAAADNSDGEP